MSTTVDESVIRPGAPGAPPIMSVIDIGSSGIRMLVVELRADGSVRTLEELDRPLALGREAFRSGILTAGSIQKAVNILRQYRERMTAYGVTHVRAVATHAVRAALNRDTFVDRVFLATGIEVEVIEGSQETLLTFAAVEKALAVHPEYRQGEALLFELGGGSTEWALLRNGEVVASVTYDLGTVRMREALRAAENERRAKTRLMQHIVREMMQVVRRSLPFEKLSLLLAIGSEARFAARELARGDKERGAAPPADAVEMRVIGVKDLKKLADQILTLAPDEIAGTFSVPPNESEALAPALLTYAEVARLCQLDSIVVPHESMRDGLVLHMARSIRDGSTVLFPNQTIAAAVNLARKYQADEKHGVHVAALGRTIFQATKTQHQMGEREQLLLEVAAIVHDIGTFVAARGHHRHSYYLLVNSEVFGLSRTDLEIVANLARYHRREGPQSDHPAYASLPRAARLTVNRLAAILRVADALDKGHMQRVQNPRVSVNDDELRVEVEAAEDLALERIALESKGGLFEEVFGLKPVLVETTAVPA
ncbi:MAG TPA: Ppx/GppA phosphatase family protein [Candidatus Eisenbacteria bacterium]|nr:Ppx/GppA phosphatase family protein [Candidatus Eisenbacteria bacterium]